jgi:hypothetical protein
VVISRPSPTSDIGSQAYGIGIEADARSPFLPYLTFFCFLPSTNTPLWNPQLYHLKIKQHTDKEDAFLSVHHFILFTFELGPQFSKLSFGIPESYDELDVRCIQLANH